MQEGDAGYTSLCESFDFSWQNDDDSSHMILNTVQVKAHKHHNVNGKTSALVSWMTSGEQSDGEARSRSTTKANAPPTSAGVCLAGCEETIVARHVKQGDADVGSRRCRARCVPSIPSLSSLYQARPGRSRRSFYMSHRSHNSKIRLQRRRRKSINQVCMRVRIKYFLYYHAFSMY